LAAIASASGFPFLSFTPAALPWMVWRKWEVLDELVTEDAYADPRLDNRVIVELGRIKADILRFGISDPD